MSKSECTSPPRMTDPTLQVSPSATDAELRSAYKKGALKHHPGTWSLVQMHTSQANN